MTRPDANKSTADVLMEDGWTRQFAADEPRLSEAVEMYRGIGFEVRLEPLPAEPECESCSGEKGKAGCRVCYEGFEERYKVIFTRPRRTEPDPEGDRF